MSEFKPMVKMETTEPSIELKLARGGHVAMKHGEKGEEHGHRRMHETRDEHYSPEGRAPRKPSASDRRRAMNPNLYAKGGEVECERELKAHEHKPAHLGHRGLKDGGEVMRKADGGAVTGSMTKTTVKGNAGKFVSDMGTMEHGSKAKRGTGDVNYGGTAGYKRGGKVEHKAAGGAARFIDDISTAEHGSKAKRGTGDVGLGNAGYKRGGKVEHKARGGEAGVGRAVEGNEGKFTNGNITDGERHDGAKGTGEVRFGNEGGYKHGGKARGKAYATGGEVDTGRAVKMPHKPKSQPVANSLQSGTFRKGGVAKLAMGGAPPIPAAPASGASNPEAAAILDDLAAMKQQEMNNAGYNAATRQVPTPGILQRMQNGLGFKKGGKAK
jgi:hypothetical protein